MKIKITVNKSGIQKLIRMLVLNRKDQEVIITVEPVYSRSKQAVLHIYFREVAKELLNLGNSLAADLIPGSDGPMNEVIVKEYFKKSFLNGRSTTELSSDELSSLLQAINLWAKTNLSLDLEMQHSGNVQSAR